MLLNEEFIRTYDQLSESWLEENLPKLYRPDPEKYFEDITSSDTAIKTFIKELLAPAVKGRARPDFSSAYHGVLASNTNADNVVIGHNSLCNYSAFCKKLMSYGIDKDMLKTLIVNGNEPVGIGNRSKNSVITNDTNKKQDDNITKNVSKNNYGRLANSVANYIFEDEDFKNMLQNAADSMVVCYDEDVIDMARELLSKVHIPAEEIDELALNVCAKLERMTTSIDINNAAYTDVYDELDRFGKLRGTQIG